MTSRPLLNSRPLFDADLHLDRHAEVEALTMQAVCLRAHDGAGAVHQRLCGAQRCHVALTGFYSGAL